MWRKNCKINLRRGVEKINLIKLLDRLEELVETSFRIPIFGKIIVDEEKFFVLCNKVRTSIPEEIKQANILLKEKERIREESEAKAREIINLAEEKANNLVKESEIYTRAQEEAKAVLKESRRRADEVELGVNEYAHKILSGLEEYLQNIMGVIKKSKEELEGKIITSAKEK